MTKIIKSPSTVWVGSVHLADPMTMPQVKLFDEALEQTKKEELTKAATGVNADGEPTIKTFMVDERMLPAICACVEVWEIEGFPKVVTPETFPLTPRPASHDFIGKLFAEIYKVYLGEIQIPNV